jgi:hypothetical protein
LDLEDELSPDLLISLSENTDIMYGSPVMNNDFEKITIIDMAPNSQGELKLSCQLTTSEESEDLFALASHSNITSNLSKSTCL